MHAVSKSRECWQSTTAIYSHSQLHQPISSNMRSHSAPWCEQSFGRHSRIFNVLAQCFWDSVFESKKVFMLHRLYASICGMVRAMRRVSCIFDTHVELVIHISHCGWQAQETQILISNKIWYLTEAIQTNIHQCSYEAHQSGAFSRIYFRVKRLGSWYIFLVHARIFSLFV